MSVKITSLLRYQSVCLCQPGEHVVLFQVSRPLAVTLTIYPIRLLCSRTAACTLLMVPFFLNCTFIKSTQEWSLYWYKICTHLFIVCKVVTVMYLYCSWQSFSVKRFVFTTTSVYSFYSLYIFELFQESVL